MASVEPLRVEVVYSPEAGQVESWSFTLPPGSTVSEAIERSGVLSRYSELSLPLLSVGVWGATRSLQDLLRDRDRVELYRPLKVDPKEARRLRYSSHREKTKR
ncbi:MAG: RnfH family protein [Rhizobacter sp.]